MYENNSHLGGLSMKIIVLWVAVGLFNWVLLKVIIIALFECMLSMSMKLFCGLYF